MIIYLTTIAVHRKGTEEALNPPSFPVPPDLDITLDAFLKNAKGIRGGWGVFDVAKRIELLFITKQGHVLNPGPQKYKRLQRYNTIRIWRGDDPVQVDLSIAPRFFKRHDTDLRWMDLTFCRVRELICEVYHQPNFRRGLREWWRGWRGVGSSLNQLF